MYTYKALLDRVIDGDTIDVNIDLGFKITTNQRIRFANIDTPEIFHTSTDSEEYKRGLEAKKFIEQRFAQNNNEMTLVTYKAMGLHGRYTGIIWLKDSKISLNEELIQKNLANKV